MAMYLYPSYLRRLMERRKLSVAAVAALTRRRASTVEAWLAGKKKIPFDVLSRLAPDTGVLSIRS